jgi:hypothetical protein
MINRWFSILAAMLLTSAAPALAQQNFRHRPATDPYRNLFTTPQVSGDTPRVERHLTKKDIPAQRQKPVLNCGMLVVPADPSVDPKIRVGPREDAVWNTMRVVPPPTCNSGRR